jgi:Tol biopolymer transport system component
MLGRLESVRSLRAYFFAAFMAIIFAATIISGAAIAAYEDRMDRFVGSFMHVPPTPTPTPDPQRKPEVPSLVSVDLSVQEPIRLTDHGCCSHASWSPDSEWVVFLDKPGSNETAGFYGVHADGGKVTLFNARVGEYSRSQTLVSYEEGGRVFVERWADGTRWVIPSEGRKIRFSPSGRYVSWEVTSRSIRFPDVRQRAIWVARSDGTEAREIVTVNGGEMVGWTGGEDAIIVTGRLAPDWPSGIWHIKVGNGAGRLLFEVDRPRSPLLSPSGSWIAFYTAFDPDPERNGLWVMQTNGAGIRKLDLFGAYRWREEGSLLVIPLSLDSSGSSLWQVDAYSGEATRLTDPAHTALPIANNDWELAPNGDKLFFLSSDDHNLWVLTLPNP